MSGRPGEKLLQRAQRGVESRLAEAIFGPNAGLLGETRLEALGLLDVVSLKITELGIGLEPVQGLRDAVEGRLTETLGLGQVAVMRALDRSF
jgi:hypothetical protein